MGDKGGPIFLLFAAAIIFIMAIKGSYKLIPLWRGVDGKTVDIVNGIVKSWGNTPPGPNSTTPGSQDNKP